MTDYTKTNKPAWEIHAEQACKSQLPLAQADHWRQAYRALEVEYNARLKPQLTADDKTEAVWECINEQSNRELERMRVAGGWLVKATDIDAQTGETRALALTFVPDSTHRWLKAYQPLPDELKATENDS